jgi:hypothetical protein
MLQKRTQITIQLKIVLNLLLQQLESEFLPEELTFYCTVSPVRKTADEIRITMFPNASA